MVKSMCIYVYIFDLFDIWERIKYIDYVYFVNVNCDDELVICV